MIAHVLFHLSLVAIADRFHVEGLCPEFASPEVFSLDVWMHSEELFGGERFDDLHDAGGAHLGFRLDDHVDMVIGNLNLRDPHFVVIGCFFDDVLHMSSVRFLEDGFPVFGDPDEVVGNPKDVMGVSRQFHDG